MLKKAEKAQIILLCIFMLFGLSSCTKKEKIRIGLNAWPGYEFLYLLNKKAIDKKFGVETEIIIFNSLADGRRSFERGELDFLGTTIVEAILIHQNSTSDPKIVYVADYSNGADVVVAPSKYKTMKDLKGKRVGVESGTVCIYTLFLALQKQGMSLSDVKIVEADQDAILKGLSDGSLDAGVTYPPFSIEILKGKSFKQLYTSSESPKKIVDVLVAKGSVLESRAKEINGVLKAFENARADSMKGDNNYIELMAEREKISPQEFKNTLMHDIRMMSYDEQQPEYFASGLLSTNIAETFLALKETNKTSSSVLNPKDLIREVFGE